MLINTIYRCTSISIFALGFIFSASVNAGDEMRVIQLKHRTADEILPIIRPLLGPSDAMSGTDFRLIVRTSDKNLKEIERILAQIDVARRQLRIIVKQAVIENKDNTTHELSGEVRAGKNTRITLPADSTARNPGLTVQRGGNDNIQYRTSRTTTATRDDQTQSVLTMDGQRAYIRVGQSVPHVRRILALTHNQVIMTQGVELQDVVTGFEVLPRIQGDRVLLDITPRLSTLQNPNTGLASFHELTTTVTAKLGEWIDLGEISGSSDEVRHAILESSTTRAGVRRAAS